MGNHINRINLIRYAFLAWPLAFVGLPLYIYVPDFYLREQRLSLGVLALVLFGVRGLDAFIDPFLGLLSDRLHHYRLQLMIIAGIILSMGIMTLLNPPDRHPVLWFTIGLCAATFSFSLLTINLQTLGSLWGANAQDRLRINVWREAFSIIGLVTSAVVPSLLMTQHSTAHALSIFSVFQAALLGVGLIGLIRWSRKNGPLLTPTASENATYTRWPSLSAEYKGFFVTYGLSMLASALPAVLVLSFVRDYVSGQPEWTAIFLLIYFSSALIALPLWQRLAKSIERYRLWLCAMALAAISLSICLVMPKGDIAVYALICLLSGAALSAELVLPPAILSDMLDHTSSHAHISAYFSFMVFLTKASLALGSAFIFFIFDINDLQPVKHVPSSLLVFLYAGLPCLIKALAIVSGFRANRLTPGVNHVQIAP